MGESNSVIVRKAYEDFAHGNIPSVFAAFDAGITSHPSFFIQRKDSTSSELRRYAPSSAARRSLEDLTGDLSVVQGRAEGELGGEREEPPRRHPSGTRRLARGQVYCLWHAGVRK